MTIGSTPPLGHQDSVSLNRSCENCRERKIKCLSKPIQEESPGNERQCARCSKLSLDCIFRSPAIKKRRRRNETRIKELEQKLHEIEDAVARENDDRELGQLNDKDGRSPSLSFTGASITNEFTNSSESSDPIACGMIDDDTASRFTQVFRNHLAPTYPLVKLSGDMSWKRLRNEMPSLFRAILTAAASSSDPKLFKALFHHTAKYLADEVVVHGRKTLDLVQALLIMAIWHYPAEQFNELKFSQYAHMASTMVTDLRCSNDTSYDIPSRDRSSMPTDREVKICRTYLASYLLCSSISLTLRRQNQYQYSPWVDDCMAILLKSPITDLDDMRLVEWTKLQRMAEEGLSVSGFNQGSTLDYTNVRTRYVLRSCMDRVVSWRHNLPNELVTDAIAMHYNMILANLHEPALYDGHDWRDFRPPYKLRSLLLMNKMYDDIALDTASALDCCIKSAEAIIHTFLNVTISTLRSVPVIMYARTVYAVVILIKFDVSAQNLLGAASLLQKDSSSKNLLLQLIEKLQNAVGPEGFQIPATFCAILSRMATWYIEHVDDSSPFFEQRFGDNAIEPLEQLNPDSAPWNESRGSSWECPQMARPNSCEWHNTADLWLGTMQVRPASNNPNASTYLGIGTQQ